LKKAFNFYINSSLHVAFAVVAFTLITILNFKVPVNFTLLLFIFFSTITGYNFIKYAAIAKFHHFSLRPGLKIIQFFSLLCFGCTIATLFFQSIEVIITSAILGIFTLLYALPVTGNGNLRAIPGLKIYITAFVVAGVTVVLPLISQGHFPKFDHVIDFLQRVLIAIVLILPFEIRDLDRDIARLETIPQKLGILSTKKLGYVLVLVFCLLEIFKTQTNIAYLISLLFLGILCVFFLMRSSEVQGKYFASFWVEAAPLFWLGVLYLLDKVI